MPTAIISGIEPLPYYSELAFILSQKQAKKVDFHFKKLNSLSTYLTDFVNMLWKTFEDYLLWRITGLLKCYCKWFHYFYNKDEKRKSAKYLFEERRSSCFRTQRYSSIKNQLTQEALAERLKVSRSAIARWESKRYPWLEISSSIRIWHQLDTSGEAGVWRKKVIRQQGQKWHYFDLSSTFFSILVYISYSLPQLPYLALKHPLHPLYAIL